MRVDGIPYVQGRNSYSDPDGTKFGIAIHNTSNDASAEGEASYATRRTDGVSSHFYCDNDSVVQSLDTSARAGHAGSANGNNHAVAVEITGTNGKSREWWLGNVAWDKLGAVLAQVCRAYGIAVRRASVAEMQANPKVKAFYSHDDMRRAWGGTDHTDPGPNFPWDRLFEAVNAAMGGTSATGGGDDMTPDEHNTLVAIGQRVVALEARLYEFVQGRVDPKFGPIAGNPDERIIPNERLLQLLADTAELKGRPPAAVTDAQAAALADRVADLLTARVEAAAEAAVRRVLGGLDGAVPPAA